MEWKEGIGYAGSVLVLISLTLSSIVRLRLVNMLGGALFAVYGGLLGAWPVLILNSLTASINLVYLIRMSRTSSAFELLEIQRADNRYLRRFLEFHGEDIARFFPGFDPAVLEGAEIVFILRDMLPVGLVVTRAEGEERVVEIDYVVPSDRDFRCGEFYFRERGALAATAGARRFVARADTEPHARYLRRMGFSADGGRFVMELESGRG